MSVIVPVPRFAPLMELETELAMTGASVRQHPAAIERKG